MVDCGDVPAHSLTLSKVSNARGVVSVNIADQTLENMHTREKVLRLRLGFCLLFLCLSVPCQLTGGTLGSSNIQVLRDGAEATEYRSYGQRTLTD